MDYRILLISALMLSLAAGAGYATLTIADQARSEQPTYSVQHSDEIVMQVGVRQVVPSADGDDPATYGDSVTVTDDGTTLESGTDYRYFPSTGEIVFQDTSAVTDGDAATIDVTYGLPADSTGDAVMQELTSGASLVLILAAGLSLVGLAIWFGRAVLKQLGTGRGSFQSRR